MKNLSALLLALFVLGFVSCTKKDDPSNPVTPTTPEEPYFEYKINNNSAVHVDCSAIKFLAASGGNTVTLVVATSSSTNSTFTFAFYGAATALDTVKTGSHPLLAYSSFMPVSSAIPMHLSLKVPQTTGSNDYFYSLAPSEATHKHTIKSITKGDVESGRRIYWVEGEYSCKGQQLPGTTTATISGKYRFKLLAIQ
ncbi:MULTISPECIES: hypothetical protein [unclassified Arcicella]|uniref:hypothetical protein n=1 Tax=unclassified Arcicella TaxID=2644986 RepID=UPI002854C83E|nr:MULTISPECIES: hypothetical protein [unclassified Arcicella]MDR6563200.1 hypothetical protein [Arcicella sp. BE51]MDR6811649.1 hypothetical protein [Arcicella sp. BE140]MDR6823174.1 hypothetical protein [Arcicella sp. BE139]